ncbi:hypothetical protein [Planococcus shixiaomingii]|nr:hypothetical protein [Planococcus sp. N028]
MEQDAYIDMFKQQAKFFIENRFSDPHMYYANLLAEQKQAAGS